MNEYDVIVVGVGTMGAPTCYELAKRGKRVLGLDQFDIPNTRASHHGSSRMIRLAYFEHPDYVTLLRRAFELWEKIEQDSQQALVHMCGGLYMGPPDSELVSGSLAAAQQHDLSHEMLDHRDLSRRYARFHLPKTTLASLRREPDSCCRNAPSRHTLTRRCGTALRSMTTNR